MKKSRKVSRANAPDETVHDQVATMQATILHALPAHVALLDPQGLIISVNEAWRRLADANVFQAPGHGIGLNCLEICDSLRGDDSVEAHRAADGIRSVLDGMEKSLSVEYPCHSPSEQRWFLMTVTSFAADQKNGAVVMHLDITERKREEDALRQNEEQFCAMIELASVGIRLDRQVKSGRLRMSEGALSRQVSCETQPAHSRDPRVLRTSGLCPQRMFSSRHHG